MPNMFVKFPIPILVWKSSTNNFTQEKRIIYLRQLIMNNLFIALKKLIFILKHFYINEQNNENNLRIKIIKEKLNQRNYPIK